MCRELPSVVEEVDEEYHKTWTPIGTTTAGPPVFPTKALYYDWQLKTRPPRVVEKIAYDKTKDKGLSKKIIASFV